VFGIACSRIFTHRSIATFEHKSPEMKLNATGTALVFTDLHNDFLSP
jgi:hypothetical protein